VIDGHCECDETELQEILAAQPFMFEVANCDLKAANFLAASWNMKSEATSCGSEASPKKLGDADFRIRPVYLPQCFADFTYGGVGANGVDDVGHSIDI